MVVEGIKNYRDIKKAILNITKDEDIELKVACYTSLDCDSETKTISTDLEIAIYKSGEFYEVLSIYGFEDTYDEDFKQIIDKHRKELSKLKKRVFNYLKLHFNNVEFSDDYTQ